MKKENIVKIKDNKKERPPEHYMNLPEEKQEEIDELAEVFHDEEKLKLCFQSIGTFNTLHGYKEEQEGVHYMMEDIIDLAIKTYREELEYDMEFSKYFRKLIDLQKEMDKLKDEVKK